MKPLSRIFVPALLLLAPMVIGGCNREQGEATDNRTLTETVFSQMTESRKIGQIFCITIDPIRYFLEPAYQEKIKGFIRTYSPGAFFLSSDLESYKEETLIEFNAVKLRGIVQEIRSLTDIPPLIAADFETGAWLWDHTATRFTCPMAVGATNTPALAYRQGKITAMEARAQGIQWIFAPLINTSSTKKTLFSDVSCYGSDPERTADFVSQLVHGVQDSGVAACLKYFDPSDIESEMPLRSGIDAGALSVMGLPFAPDDTASSVQLKDILAAKHGFQGVVLRSITPADSTADLNRTAAGLVESFKSGQDMVIFPGDADRYRPLLNFLLTQAQTRNLDISVFDAPVKKILLFKEKLGIRNTEREDMVSLSGIGIREFHQTADDITRESVTLLKNEGNIIPLKYPGRYTLFVNFIDRFSAADGVYFSDAVLKEYAETKVMSVSPVPDARTVQEILRRAGDADRVICTLFIKPGPEDPFPQIPAGQIGLLRNLAGGGHSTVCISFYSPMYINDIPGVKAFMTTYSLSPASMRAAIDVLYGKSGVSGKLPIEVSKSYPAGFGLTLPGPEMLPKTAQNSGIALPAAR